MTYTFTLTLPVAIHPVILLLLFILCFILLLKVWSYPLISSGIYHALCRYSALSKQKVQDIASLIAFEYTFSCTWAFIRIIRKVKQASKEISDRRNKK